METQDFKARLNNTASWVKQGKPADFTLERLSKGQLGKVRGSFAAAVLAGGMMGYKGADEFLKKNDEHRLAKGKEPHNPFIQKIIKFGAAAGGILALLKVLPKAVIKRLKP